MICPSCGADAGNAKFCENCGASLMTAAQEPAGYAAKQSTVEFAEAPDAPSYGVEPEPPYRSEAYQQQASYQQPSPYQQSVPYQPPVSQANMAPNAAFVLVIVGLILSILGATFLPGLVCSIVGLVLNAGYNKQGLNNPHGTSTKVVGIIGIVVSALVILSFVFLGIFAALIVNEAEEQGIDLTTSDASVSVNSSGVSVTVPGSSGSASSGGSASQGSQSGDALYHDSDYNLTMYALMELSGKEWVSLLDSYNFSWDSSENAWMASDGSIFAVTDGSKLLSKSEVEALPKGGVGKSVVLCQIVEGYSTPQAAYKALSGNIVAEEYSEKSDAVVAMVYGPSMVRYIALIGPSGDASGEQMVYLFTEDAVKGGALTSMLGYDVGSNLDEVWQSLMS